MKTYYVPFYKSELCVSIDDAGKAWVAVRHLCLALGLSHSAQEKKIKSHPVLGSNVAIIATLDKADREMKMLCINLDCVSYWLSTINPHKTAVPIEDLKIYQEHCAKAIQAHFAYVPQASTMSGIYSRCMDEIGHKSHQDTARDYYNSQLEITEFAPDEEVNDDCLFNEVQE